LFMSTGRDVSELRPHSAYCSSPIYMICRAILEWCLPGKTENNRIKTCPSVTFVHHISHGLTRARARDSSVRDRRVTAWAMAWRAWYDNELYIRLTFHRFLYP